MSQKETGGLVFTGRILGNSVNTFWTAKMTEMIHKALVMGDDDQLKCLAV